MAYTITLQWEAGLFDERGFAWVMHSDLPDNSVHIRSWFKPVAKIPVIGKWLITRILRHEIDHFIDEGFRYPKQHHVHLCGRSTRWYSVISDIHLETTKADAWKLFKTGSLEVTYNEGSRADESVKAGY